jgi:hypothetical protein
MAKFVTLYHQERSPFLGLLIVNNRKGEKSVQNMDERE